MLKKKHSPGKYLPRGLEILYEDRDILVVDKPAGLLTVGTETNKFKTAYYVLTDYVRKGCLKSRNRIFIVHRLDQWTSGVLVFAKSEEAKFRLQAQWKATEKKYVGVVYGQLAQKEGMITSYLSENKAYVVYSTTDVTKGKLAHTGYKVLKETKQFSLLEINVLRNGDTHEVDCEQEPIDDAEELEGDAVKIHQQDGETEGKEQACDQCHEGQPAADNSAAVIA